MANKKRALLSCDGHNMPAKTYKIGKFECEISSWDQYLGNHNGNSLVFIAEWKLIWAESGAVGGYFCLHLKNKNTEISVLRACDE